MDNRSRILLVGIMVTTLRVLYLHLENHMHCISQLPLIIQTHKQKKSLMENVLFYIVVLRCYDWRYNLEIPSVTHFIQGVHS